MSERLRTISSDAEELYGQAGGHAGAAAETSIGGALDGVMGQWAAHLPRFGLAGERLRTAMHGAATAYQSADAAVGDAAGGSEQM
jgi:hypothetical protein